jgi:hypothetical protein
VVFLGDGTFYSTFVVEGKEKGFFSDKCASGSFSRSFDQQYNIAVPNPNNMAPPVYIPGKKRKQQQPRFHGAFTGGFSAGFFNTVSQKIGASFLSCLTPFLTLDLLDVR